MSNALSILGDGYTIAISPDAEESKLRIIAASRAIVAVTDSPSCDDAQARIRELAAARIAVEKSREIVKRPVIDLGKKIDGIAKDFAADINAEESRLTAMVNAYAAEQQRIAREATAAAERERQRIEREEHEARMAALRAEQEAERQRMEAERQKHEAEMSKLRAERQQDEAAQAQAAAAERAAAEAQRIATEQANAARLAAEQAAADARAATAAVVVAATVMPQGVKEEIDFEVVDIAEFAAKFPQFVTITPKRADILAALKKSFAAKGKLPEVAGLRVFQNLKVKTR
jgi:hypothetical protein